MDTQTAATMRLGVTSSTDASATSLDTRTIQMGNSAARMATDTTQMAGFAAPPFMSMITTRIDAVKRRTMIIRREGAIKQLLATLRESC